MNKITFREFDRKHSKMQNKDPTEKKPWDIDFVMENASITMEEFNRQYEHLRIRRPAYGARPEFTWSVAQAILNDWEEQNNIEEEPEDEEEQEEETNEDEDILF